MTAALTLVDVGCGRGERRLFRGVSAVVPAGCLLRIGGANGVGKTTLLRAICGLVEPDEGRISWWGGSTASLRDAGRLLFVGHASALKEDLTALENLQSGRGLAGWPSNMARVEDALASAGLRGFERLPVRLLSQGQRKRAALAQLAVSATAALWVLDEPFEALDDVAVDWVMRLVFAQLCRGGVVVLTSHVEPKDPPWSAAAAVDVDLDAHRLVQAQVRA